MNNEKNIFKIDDYKNSFVDMKELISELIEGKSNSNNIDDKTLSYLLILLKNKNVKFDNNYLNLILKLTQILNSINLDTDKFKFIINLQNEVLPEEFCQMLAFFAIDYNRVIELNDKEDLSLLNALCSNALFDLCNLVVYQEYEKILNEIKVYNEIIYNILKNNINYMKNYIFRKEKFYKEFYKKHKYIDNVEDCMINFENSIFLITIEIFISNIRTLNYNYDLISEVMEYMKNYIKDNYRYIVDGSISFLDIQEYILELLKELNQKKIYVISH